MGIPGAAGANQQGRLGRYELLARLATGGMGEIFLARLEGAEGFEKLYVVKRILAHLADDARFRQMLIAEARIASKMAHPNICQVFELGETEGQLYIVMEYLEGISLLPLLRRFSKEQMALDLGFVAGVFQQTTDAMNYAHELKDRNGESLGIIHRDVTPSNIFLTDNGVGKVLDFGIAKARGASTQTQEGTVKGKYAYMAPEQLKGAAIDRRVDIFAMGIVLYEMLALRRLFQRKTDYLTFRAVMEQPIPDVRRYRPDVPEGVAQAIIRALDRDPRNRFETARQFGAAVLDGLGIRPWGQGEIGDFVQHNFASEIGKRHAQVANVVQRTNVSARPTMPLLSTPDEELHDNDDDDEFPSVETEVEGAPPWMQRPTPQPPSMHASHSADFAASTGSGTPPPFGSDVTGSSMPSLQPLRGAPITPPNLGSTGSVVVVQQKRSIVWPLLAVAMVAVAAGALLLVYKQMQQQQQPAEIKITQEPVQPTHPVGPTQVMNQEGNDGSAALPDTPPVEDAGSATEKGSAVKPTVAVKKKARTYDDAVLEKKAEMEGCFNSHRDVALPAERIYAALKITAAGKATQVEITPASLNASTLGQCLRNVLGSAKFPTAPNDNNIRFPLSPK
jgi:eukaryotic-like serine/threonine-protein kinase